MASKLDNDALDELFSNLKEKKISKVDEPKKKRLKQLNVAVRLKKLILKAMPTRT